MTLNLCTITNGRALFKKHSTVCREYNEHSQKSYQISDRQTHTHTHTISTCCCNKDEKHDEKNRNLAIKINDLWNGNWLLCRAKGNYALFFVVWMANHLFHSDNFCVFVEVKTLLTRRKCYQWPIFPSVDDDIFYIPNRIGQLDEFY
jgi:hypothetical protein